MKSKIFIILILFLSFSGTMLAQEEDRPEVWDLKTCIEYAKRNNIQVRKSWISYAQSVENTELAKAQVFPSLSFSSGQNLVNHPKIDGGDHNSYSASYGFSSSLTLFNGGRLKKNIEQQEIQEEIQNLYVQQAENSIELSIIEAYLQILYADESVKINRNTVEVSRAQVERARVLVEAGYISRVDLAQLESQYTNDEYQLIVAQNNLEQRKLDLKQLLELDVLEDIVIAIPEITEEDILSDLPAKTMVFATALTIMPEIQNSLLGIESADLSKSIAKTGYLPSISLNAGIGTNHLSGSDNSYYSQVKYNFNESVGVSISVPIYSNRQNKTAVRIAELQIEDAELDFLNTRKNLLTNIESVYLDAVSSQNQYIAAEESVNASEESFSLTQEQFNLGMKNTVELLIEKNNLLSAQQQLIQAKYLAVLSRQYLNFYQGKEVTLETSETTELEVVE